MAKRKTKKRKSTVKRKRGPKKRQYRIFTNNILNRGASLFAGHLLRRD